MSRSYKKTPFVKDKQSSKWGKRYCNKRVRKAKDVPNGKAYRKLTEPWDFIYDYSHIEWEWEVRRGWEATQKAKAQGVGIDAWHWYNEDTLEEQLVQWRKWYKNK